MVLIQVIVNWRVEGIVQWSEPCRPLYRQHYCCWGLQVKQALEIAYLVTFNEKRASSLITLSPYEQEECHCSQNLACIEAKQGTNNL